MIEPPARRLFRSPLLQSRSCQNFDSSLQEEEPRAQNLSSIADVQTAKQPALPGNGLHVHIPQDQTLQQPGLPSPQEQKEQQLNSIAEAQTSILPAQPRITVNLRNTRTLVYNSGLAEATAATSPLAAAQNLSRQNGNAQESMLPPFIPDIHPSHSWGPRHAPLACKQRLIGSLRDKSTSGKILSIALIIALLIPSVLIIFEVVNAAILYSQVQSGIGHLQAAENIFRGGPSGNLAKYFDTNKLRQAQVQIDAAHADFVSLSSKLDHDGSINPAASLLPAQIGTARSLGHLASDATAAAQQLVKMALKIAPSLAPVLQKSSASNNTSSLQPYITPATFYEINTTIATIIPLVHDMNMHAQGLSLASLPISGKQRELLASLLPLLPGLEVGLRQEQQLKSAFGWLIGVDHQRSYLIEPMDSAELRATGGFTGQFGDLVLNGGHMSPLNLKNIGKYEEDHSAEGSPPDMTVYAKVIGQRPPAPYSAWWPIPNFGLRDSNLSADFPTSARLAMQKYSYEFGGQLDGVIMFTPNLIKQVLHVTGPITIPQYKETISENNLENRLHYYQLDNRGIRREEIIEHVADPQQARKLFTQRVTKALMSTALRLPIAQLLPMANEMLRSMKSKDLQVYFSNPQLEALLATYGSTDSLDRSNNHDGLYLVQSNLSANKASQYVTTALRDTITLDARGGATHQLQMTLDYQQKGDVYGLDTYRDYIRVYVPVNSRFLKGNGFDQSDRPYCGDAQSGYRLCPRNVYGDGSLVCSSQVEIGFASSYINDPYSGTDHPLDLTGPPQNLHSDEPGRAMFGGWVVIPKNCRMRVTLSWYVPPMGQHPYSLLIQPQASVDPLLELTVKPAPGTCLSSRANTLHYASIMHGQDTTFSVRQQASSCALLPGT